MVYFVCFVKMIRNKQMAAQKADEQRRSKKVKVNDAAAIKAKKPHSNFPWGKLTAKVNDADYDSITRESWISMVCVVGLCS